MDEPITIHPLPPPDGPSAPDFHPAARRALLRRLRMLLVAGTAAFALTAWSLVRFPNFFGPFEPGANPAGVVRAHLEALARGDLRAAYEQFSERYRQQASFEAFDDLVRTHHKIFALREFRLGSDVESGGRAVLETDIVAADGTRYVARFTLVRSGGRWWIDDLHWRGEARARAGAKA